MLGGNSLKLAVPVACECCTNNRVGEDLGGIALGGGPKVGRDSEEVVEGIQIGLGKSMARRGVLSEMCWEGTPASRLGDGSYELGGVDSRGDAVGCCKDNLRFGGDDRSIEARGGRS